MRISFVSTTPTKQIQKPILVLRDPALREFNSTSPHSPPRQSQKPILVLRDPALREFNENAMPPPHFVPPLPYLLCDIR